MKNKYFHRQTFVHLASVVWHFLTFGALLFIFLWRRLFGRLVKSERLDRYYERLINLLDAGRDPNSIRRVELMEITVRNMQMKKTRSLVTIGGMALGIGVIVFLVSIGYGLQDLVISRVARLEEMKQIDVTVQSGSKLKINDKSLAALSRIKNVVNVLPLIGVVAQVNYKLSVSDMPAYGVTADYLNHSATKTVRGKFFVSNQITYEKKSDEKDDQMGMTQTLETSSASLEKTASPASIFDININELLASEAGTIQEQKTKQVSLGSQAYRQAIVNRAMLKILNLKESEALGKTFDASFVVVGALVDDREKIQSENDEYKIVGVIPDERSPFFYVPLMDLRSLGIDNFSQVKVILKDKESVADTRKRIEAIGFGTASVVDTVAQISNLFSSLRLLLALLGTVALAVAALGMFNTLTVSLLERTHEVGLMKTMGMKSSEVQELFLTESMIMGFAGGILGLFLGFAAGKGLGFILSVFAIFKGVGYLDVASLPLVFIILILILSIFVGFATGIYPAQRAKKISALNALRYE